jgi:hypothetical protein
MKTVKRLRNHNRLGKTSSKQVYGQSTRLLGRKKVLGRHGVLVALPASGKVAQRPAQSGGDLES